MRGSLPTSARLRPQMRLNKVDLPTLGRPRITKCGSVLIAKGATWTLPCYSFEEEIKRQRAVREWLSGTKHQLQGRLLAGLKRGATQQQDPAVNDQAPRRQ